MKEKIYFKQLFLSFIICFIPVGFFTVCNLEKNDMKKSGLIDKVKTAMLTMQRATWEQGVAMQAMLELGEEKLLILMAKDAVLRQSADGRLAESLP